MATRLFAQQQYNGDRGVVILFAAVAFNGSSAPTLLTCALSSGNYTAAPTAGTSFFTGFTRASTGNYSLNLRDKYVRLLGFNVAFISSSNAAAPIAQVKVATDPTNGQAFGTNVGAGAIRTGSPTVNVLTFSAQGTLADPGAAEIALIELILQNETTQVP